MFWWIVIVLITDTDLDVVGECRRVLSLRGCREGRLRRRWEADGKEAGQTRPLGLGLWIRWTQRVGRSVQLRSVGHGPQLRTHQLRARHQRGASHRWPTDRRAGRETRAVPGGRRETSALSRAHREARPGARRPPSAIPGQGTGQDPGRPSRALPRVRATALARLRQGTPRARLRNLRLRSRPRLRFQQQLRDPPLMVFLYTLHSLYYYH